ncbi:MAG: hypothetical protein GON13_03965 [Nanoarchaeota archaeon]|nr:hypothetical protein [Nanoarchaeota archaeon]
MKKFLLITLILFSGCISGNNFDTGVKVYENFCGDTDFSVLQDKGSRIYSLLTNSEVVIAVRDGITGAMVMVGGGDYTYAYLPEEVGEDDYLIFIDKNALENKDSYCDYAITVNQRTDEFIIINATRLQLLN